LAKAIEYLEDDGDYESENEKEDEEFTPVLSGYSNLELPFLSWINLNYTPNLGIHLVMNQ